MSDSLAPSGLIVGIDELRSIQIVKKSKIFQGLGVGLLEGAGSGACLILLHGGDTERWFRFPAGQYALAVGLTFGVWGASFSGGSSALK